MIEPVLALSFQDVWSFLGQALLVILVLVVARLAWLFLEAFFSGRL